jgi:putative methyltransferase (TIGR04325 family)
MQTDRAAKTRARRIRHCLKLVTPPLAIDAARRVRAAFRTPPLLPWEHVADAFARHKQQWSGVVVSTEAARWESFKGAISGPGPLGVNHEAPVPTRDDLCAHNTIMSFAYVLSMVSRRAEKISVLDWGGSVGHYYLLAMQLLPDLNMEYCCKEVPAIAEIGRRLLPEIRFTDDEHACLDRSYDLVMASGSLQYSPNWRDTMAGLFRASARYLFVTRLLSVKDVPSFTVVQRPYSFGYRTELATWVLNRNDLVEYSVKNGFRLVREFMLEPGPLIAGAPAQSDFRGYLFYVQS